MTYRATNDVVRRVLPLIERVATRSIDKARLLQYLSARAGVDWGVHALVDDRIAPHPDGGDATPARHLTFRDAATGNDAILRYPDCLLGCPPELDRLLIDEYKRLATDRPLTVMAQPLFDYFYRDEFCRRCRWRGAAHAQVQRECHFAGRPVNFEPDPPVSGA